MKVAVYTANFNGKDETREQDREDGVDYYCFTDSPKMVNDMWEKVIVPQFMDNSPRKTARWFKMMSHILFRDYDYTIWIDGRIKMLHSVEYYIDLLKGNHFAVTRHPRRDCIYDEAKACIDRKLDDEKKINFLMNEFKEREYPEHDGLCETSILVRDNSEEVKKVNLSWLNMILNHTIRDQLSFNYILWGYKLSWSEIPYTTVNRGSHAHAK